jgi:hypothetical protein
MSINNENFGAESADEADSEISDGAAQVPLLSRSLLLFADASGGASVLQRPEGAIGLHINRH